MKLHYLLVALILWPCSLNSGRCVSADDEKEKEIVADGPWISAVAWRSDQEILGTRSQGLLFRSADVVKASAATPNEFEVVGSSETSLWALLPTHDGKIIASNYKGGVLLFGDGEPQSFDLEVRWIRAISDSPNAGELLAGTEDGKLLVLSVADKKELRRVDAHNAAIFDIAVSAKGDKIATAAGDGSIKLFSWPELEPLGEMSVGKDAVWSLVFVNDDQQLVSGGADRGIQLWDVAAVKPIVTIATAHNWVTSVLALPKGSLVVAGCMDGNLVVADYRTMRGVTTQAGPGSAIWSLALSPNGKRVAVGTRKHGVEILRVAPWKKAGRAAAKEAKAIRPPAPKKKK